MDFAKLNPWNWFKKEEERPGALPVHRGGQAEAPAHALGALHDEIDRLFEGLWRGFGAGGEGAQAPGGLLKPRVDIAGSEKEYVVSAELPGLDEKDISVELRGDALILRGEKRREAESRDKGWYRMERSYGSFQRVLSVPADADPEGIRATYRGGVLRVTLPRTKAAQAPVRTIPIQ